MIPIKCWVPKNIRSKKTWWKRILVKKRFGSQIFYSKIVFRDRKNLDSKYIAAWKMFGLKRKISKKFKFQNINYLSPKTIFFWLNKTWAQNYFWQKKFGKEIFGPRISGLKNAEKCHAWEICCQKNALPEKFGVRKILARKIWVQKNFSVQNNWYSKKLWDTLKTP